MAVNEDIFEEYEECTLLKSFQNSKKKFCSWPGEMNLKVTESTSEDPIPQDEVPPLKQSVKFTLTRQKKWNEKKLLKRHHSMFQQ